MPEALARLKPDPIPAIRPVPEYAATGRLAEVYERTKRGFGVPWMGVVAMAFAHYPRFYHALWTAVEPVVATDAFADACRTLRATAEAEAEQLHPSPILPRLEGLGYGPREVNEIRASNEVFSAGNMPYLLMATLARLMLEGQAWEGTGPLRQITYHKFSLLRSPARELVCVAPRTILLGRSGLRGSARRADSSRSSRSQRSSPRPDLPA